MRIRTILAAAAAPAALAAVLLGTAGQASAATTAKTVSVYATTHESGVDDTTGVPTGYEDPNGGGPIWAYDDVERQLTATQNDNGSWSVTVRTVGTYNAFANPLDGTSWTGQGRMVSTSTWIVDASNGSPSKAHLPAQTDPSYRSQNVVAEFFGLDKNSPAVHGAITGTWDYYGIPGAPNGVMEQTA